MNKQLTEKDLLKDLNEHTSHADELAEPLPQELTPLERLKGSVKHFDPTFESLWEEDTEEAESHDTDDDSKNAES